MVYTPATERLIQALQRLPGVGTRSAQRMALQLLERDPDAGKLLCDSLSNALTLVNKCPRCRTLTEDDICSICSDEQRDASIVCVVASDADKAGIEMSASFGGVYFVLHGVLSPIDGVGPHELGIFDLVDQVKSSGVNEVIMALDSQLESQATVHYLTEQLKQVDVLLTRVEFAQMKSGSLDQAESHVIEQAMAGKKTIGFEHD